MPSVLSPEITDATRREFLALLGGSPAYSSAAPRRRMTPPRPRARATRAPSSTAVAP